MRERERETEELESNNHQPATEETRHAENEAIPHGNT